MIEFKAIVGTLKVRSQFTCHRCHLPARGARVRVEVNTDNPRDLLSAVNVSGTYREMPYGWASYYEKKGDVFRCPDCVKKGEAANGQKN